MIPMVLHVLTVDRHQIARELEAAYFLPALAGEDEQLHNCPVGRGRAGMPDLGDLMRQQEPLPTLLLLELDSFGWVGLQIALLRSHRNMILATARTCR
jgi:hypothetical protein